MAQDDLLVFAEEKKEKGLPEPGKGSWNVLIVDDEPQVHQVTKMVLRDLVFDNKNLKFFSAFSAAESMEILSGNTEFSLALVDVVMEEDDSGLRLVEYIRSTLKNEKLRIILRTGQPGFAPEKEVVINYDINDYKEKTELSAQKLTTSVISALRNYDYIDEISRLNSVLEQKVADRVSDLREANRKLQTTLEELQDDQEAGRLMQNKLLPEKSRIIQDYSFSSRLYPSLTLSGDFLDYFEINERYIGFYIADVSGHGVSSAIVTVLLKNFIDNALEKFRIEGDRMILNPDSVCRRLNEELIRENLGKYLTIFYGIIDSLEKRLHYINCGQFPYPFIMGVGIDTGITESTNVIEGKGTPVGLFKNPVFKVREMTIPDCFRLVMFSDGVLEILSQESTESKNNYLFSLFSGNCSGIESVAEMLGLESRSFFPDDLTFLVIEKGIVCEVANEQ